MFKKNLKHIIGTGLIFCGYLYAHKQINKNDLRYKSSLLHYIQLNSEQAVLLSNQISKFTNKNLNSKVLNQDSELIITNKTNKIDVCINLAFKLAFI